MTPKDYLQKRYPSMKAHWNETNIDDNWVAEMMEKFSLIKQIQENESILAMAILHMDDRAKLVIKQRIADLKALL